MVCLRLRVAVLGEPTSGKTAFVQMVYSNGMSFPKNYLMTMGCDFVIKEIALEEDNSVEVCLMDIAGQKLYERMVPTYLEAAAVFVLIYDVTNKATFETCKKWVKHARAARRDMPGILIANKMDMSDKAEVTENQGMIFARANQLKFYTCSALHGVGINEPIEELAKNFLEKYHKRIAELLPPNTA